MSTTTPTTCDGCQKAEAVTSLTLQKHSGVYGDFFEHFCNWECLHHRTVTVMRGARR